MNTALLVSSCLAGSAFTAWAVTTLVRPAPMPTRSAAAPADSAALDILRAELEALVRERVQLAAPSPAGPGVSSSPARSAVGSELGIEDVEEAVRRLVSEDALAPDPVELARWPGGARNAHAAVRAILDAGVDGEATSELWAEAAERDQLHELLAAMEEQLEALPESADKHFTRARAYYAAARAKPWNTDGNWWVDSNEAYTTALEHDPEHWGARYHKARNMAFWPVAYGGQAEAIRHFEILVEQQGSSQSRPEFVDTFLWLGNLYDQQGKTELARQTWLRGLNEFPDSDRIQGRLDTLDS